MTKRQLRNRRRAARLSQRLRKYPHWTKKKIITLLLKQPDHTLFFRDILNAFGVGLPDPYKPPSRLFESVRDVLVHLANTDQILAFNEKLASNPVIRLTAATWLKSARRQQDRQSDS